MEGLTIFLGTEIFGGLAGFESISDEKGGYSKPAGHIKNHNIEVDRNDDFAELDGVSI